MDARPRAVGLAMNARGDMEIILGFVALRACLIIERMFVALALIGTVYVADFEACDSGGDER